METIADAAFAPAGFASLACDARGTGASGGTFGLDGPSEVQDARDLFTWLAARTDVSDTQIGAFGLSLGGGAVWNAAVAGVPFKAIVPAITWTSLGASAQPERRAEVRRDRAARTGHPLSRWDPELAQARVDLLGGIVTPAVRSTRRPARRARSSTPSHVADAAAAGAPRLPLRHRPGARRVQVACRAEAAVPRRPRPSAGGEPDGGAADYVGRPSRGSSITSPESEPCMAGSSSRTTHGTGRPRRTATLPRTRHTSVNLPGSKRIAANSSVSRIGAADGRTARDVRRRLGQRPLFGQLRPDGDRAMVSVKGEAARR